MNDYPHDWPEIAFRIKDKAGWCCERCGAPHNPEVGYMLTVHHLVPDKSNCEEWNLAALCQRCHLHIQHKVKMDQLFMEDILDVSPWFRPHLEGYLCALKRRGEAKESLGKAQDRAGAETSGRIP